MENTYLKVGNESYRLDDLDQFSSNDQELINCCASYGSDFSLPSDATVLELSASVVRANFVGDAVESGALSKL